MTRPINYDWLLFIAWGVSEDFCDTSLQYLISLKQLSYFYSPPPSPNNYMRSCRVYTSSPQHTNINLISFFKFYASRNTFRLKCFENWNNPQFQPVKVLGAVSSYVNETILHRNPQTYGRPESLCDGLIFAVRGLYPKEFCVLEGMLRVKTFRYIQGRTCFTVVKWTLQAPGN